MMQKTIIKEIIIPSTSLSLKIAMDVFIGSCAFDKNELGCVFFGGMLISTLLYAAAAAWSPLATHPSRKVLIELTTPLLAPVMGQFICPSALSPFVMLRHQAIGIIIELLFLYGIAVTIINLQILRQHLPLPDFTKHYRQVSIHI